MRPTVSLKVMVEDYIRDHPGASQYEIAEHFGSTGVTYGNLLYSEGITRARLDLKAGRPYGKTEASTTRRSGTRCPSGSAATPPPTGPRGGSSSTAAWPVCRNPP